MVALTPRAPARSATTKRNSEFVMIIGGANRPSRVTRLSTCWKVDDVPINGKNCFGIFSRDTGHSRAGAAAQNDRDYHLIRLPMNSLLLSLQLAAYQANAGE